MSGCEELVGGVAIVVAVLGFCWYALVAARRNEGTDADLNELLVCELFPSEQFLPAAGARCQPYTGRHG